MTQEVRQRLLDDAICRLVEGQRQRARAAGELERDCRTRVPRHLDEHVDRTDPARRPCGCVVLAKLPEDHPDLVEDVAARSANGLECGESRLRTLLGNLCRGPRLQTDRGET